MKFVELTMPLNHQWMPDDVLPTSVKFFLGPKDHQEKGMVIGSDSGTCLTLPAVFEAFRKTARLDQVPLDKLVLRPTTVISIAKSEGEEINEADVQKALDTAQPGKGDALLIATGWGDKPYGESYLLGSPHLSLEAAQYLAQRMHENQSDLLLIDTALVGLAGQAPYPSSGFPCCPPPRRSRPRRACTCIFTTARKRRKILPRSWSLPARAS